MNIDHMKLLKRFNKNIMMIILWADDNIILLANEPVVVDRGMLVVEVENVII
jgi:hypothetical protein